MVKKNLIFLLLLFSLVVVSAQQQSLGTFKQYNDVILVQGCDNSTYSNITSIIYPDSTYALNNEVAMTANGDIYNYTFTLTDKLGTYTVYGHCDEDLVDTVWAYDFTITSSEQNLSPSMYFLIIGLVYAVTLVGFFGKNETITVLGGMGMMALGVWMVLNGIGDYRNTMTTTISMITIAIGFTTSLIAAFSWVNDD